MPLAGHTPVHPRWSQHHRPVATATQTARCHITRASGKGTLTPDGVWHPPTPEHVYSGPCRVSSPPTAQMRPAGDEQVSTVTYTVAIEWDANVVLVDDVVEITEAADPHLVGKRLRVTGIRHANLMWERVLEAVDDLTHREQ